MAKKNPNGKSGQGSLWKKIVSWYKPRHRWQKILIWLVLIWSFLYAQAWVFAQWYIQKHKNEPLTFGVTFVSPYAEEFGLDSRETLDALLNDLQIKRVRLVSYWSEMEKNRGEYDFSDLDWQFDTAEKSGAKVTLAIGLRQPRWPECHAPNWIEKMNEDEWYPHLKEFMAKVIERYKDRPNLHSYQLENEYFLSAFGECKKYGVKRERLIDEFNLVKSIDPDRRLILSLGNNYFGIPLGQPRPDQYGISVYKRVWDFTFTKRYFEYPFTSWYYSWRSALIEIFTGRDSMIHELQAEPWGPAPLKYLDIPEQNKSMDTARLKERMNYAVDTGYRDIDMWGGEWWYWRKTKFNDPSLWETVRSELKKY